MKYTILFLTIGLLLSGLRGQAHSYDITCFSKVDVIGISHSDDEIYDGLRNEFRQEENREKYLNTISPKKDTIYHIALPDSPYEGSIYISNQTGSQDYLSGSGWVKVIDKQSEKELIKVESSDLSVSLHEGKVKANIQNLPYGEQSVLIYEDFNFDGKKDFAISDGNHSCYGGPSYKIYLADTEGFSFNQKFTDLAQDYCGMFFVNEKEHTLSTMTKSGCCWLQYSVFSIKDNAPYLIKRKEIDAGGNHPIGIEEKIDYKRMRGKMVSTETLIINDWELRVDENEYRKDFAIAVYTFKNGKKMYLVKGDTNHYLYYAFTNKEDEIELLYTGDFEENLNEYCVQFINKETIYKIFNDKLEIILRSGKVITMKPTKQYNGVGVFLG